MKRQIFAATVAIAAMTSCSNDPEGGSTGRQPDDAGAEPAAASSLSPGQCPLDAGDVAAITGRKLPADPDGLGECRFGDGTADILVLVTKSSGDPENTGMRELAAQSGFQVSDLDRGEYGYLAIRGDDATANTTFGNVHLGVEITGFELDEAGFEQLAHSLIDAATD
jgi:hypothetical protein